VSIDWNALAAVHRTEGEVRTNIAEGPLAAMVERFLAEPEGERQNLVLTNEGSELDLAAVQALHARDDFPGAF
jgi:hypothetical protein